MQSKLLSYISICLINVLPAFGQQVIMGVPAECASVPSEIAVLQQNEAQASSFCSNHVFLPTITVFETEVRDIFKIYVDTVCD